MGRLASRLPGGSLTLIGGSAVIGLVVLVLLTGRLGPSTEQAGNQAAATRPFQPDVKSQAARSNLARPSPGRSSTSSKSSTRNGREPVPPRERTARPIITPQSSTRTLRTPHSGRRMRASSPSTVPRTKLYPHSWLKGINVIVQDYKPPPPYRRKRSPRMKGLMCTTARSGLPRERRTPSRQSFSTRIGSQPSRKSSGSETATMRRSG